MMCFEARNKMVRVPETANALNETTQYMFDTCCTFVLFSVVQPSRDHIFYLTFPKEVTTEDIKNLFSPFGKHWYILL